MLISRVVVRAATSGFPAGQAAEQRPDEVVDEAGEDAGGFGGIEARDSRPATLRPGPLRAPLPAGGSPALRRGLRGGGKS